MNDATPARPLVRLDAVVAGYVEPVVGPCSLELGAGDRLGIVGPNGCGKSTLLRAIVGEARVLGGRLEVAPGLRIAHQTQSFESLDEVPLDGHELLRLTGAPASGLPAWIADHLHRRVGSLSGGQRQLLRVWACLAAPGDLVLLDEPTNSLDAAGVEFLAQALASVEAGRALIIVSHDPAFSRRVCTRLHPVAA